MKMGTIKLYIHNLNALIFSIYMLILFYRVCFNMLWCTVYVHPLYSPLYSIYICYAYIPFENTMYAINRQIEPHFFHDFFSLVSSYALNFDEMQMWNMRVRFLAQQMCGVKTKRKSTTSDEKIM